MKKHFLLLALTALSSLGVWAADAAWRMTSLPGTGGEEINGVTLKPLLAPSNSCYLFGEWGQTAYVFGDTQEQIVTISTSAALQLKEVTVSIANSTNTFLIEFYDGDPAISGDLLSSATLTGSSDGAVESPCTIDNIPAGAHFARITDKTPAWNHYLYDVQVTTETAIATNAITYKSGDGQGADVVARKASGASYTLPTIDALGFTYADHILMGWKSSADDQVYPAGTVMTMATDVTYTAQWLAGAAAAWRMTSLPGTGGQELNGITLTPTVAPSSSCNLFGAWNKTGYVFNSSPVQELTISTGDALQLYEVTVSIATPGATPNFLIEFYDDPTGDLLSSASLTGSNDGSIETPCTIKNIPEGVHFARITDKSPAWNHYLYDVKVTATEAAAVTKYTATFLAGGAEGTVPAVISKEAEKTYTLPVPTNLSKAGNVFKGWKSSADDQVYPAGTVMTMGTADVTYTAQWEVGATATWRYQGGGGDEDLPNENWPSEVNGITLMSSFSPNNAAYIMGGNNYVYNYEFGGADNAIDITAPSGQELKNVTTSINFLGGAGSVKIYFSEAAAFDANQLVGDPVALTGSTDQNTELPCSIDAPDGALSARIHQDPTGWGPFLYSITVSTRAITPMTKHTASFLAGGATGTVPAAKSVGENKTYTLPEPTNLVYDKHVFIGWKYSVDNQVYPAGTQMTMGTTDVTYTAQWEVDYTATWGHLHSSTPLRNFPSATSDMLNGVQITTTTATRTSDCPAASDVGAWGGSGFSFYACSYADHYLDIQVSSEYTIEKVDASTSWNTMYIQFASSQTFDADYTLGDPIALPYNDAGNVQVVGTVTAPEGARSARITPSDVSGAWNILYYLKVYVKTLPSFNVTYNAGGADGTAPADDKAYEGAPYTLAEPTGLEKTGFVFDGWKSDIDGQVYDAGASLVVTEDVTFTAQWAVELVDPTITFNDANYIADETTLDLSTLFESNSTGAVTYTVKNAGTTGAAISGTTFTATAAGTAIVTASQARVEGQFNAKSVDATITVKAYASTADFYAEANSSSPTNVHTFLAQKHYTVVASVASDPYWDAQQSNDGGLAMTGESTTSFLVKANQKVTIKVGTLNGDQNPREAVLTMNSGTPIAIAEGSETSYTTEDETVFVITTYPATTASWAWNRIQKITISDMSPKTVNFNTNGGTPSTIDPITEASFGAGITLPDAPTKTDYIFDGWYTAEIGGTLAGAAGATYYPADNCTLHAHWAEYAKSVNFVKSAEWGGYNWDTRFNDVQDSLDLYHYTMSPLGDTQWDNQGEGAPDAGLKCENGDREFSFWVPAGKQVTIQLGTWQGDYDGANQPELYANGVKLTDLKTSQQENEPIVTTEDTKFVIKIVNPFWSLIQKIDIEDVPVSEITISELDEDNAILVANEGKTVDVQLVRSITAGMYNTLALPFAMTADQIAESDFAGSEILRLNGATFDGSTLDINFDVVDNIEAGVPYLITPAQDFTETTIPAVTIAAIEGATETVGDVEFTAILARYQITPGDNDYLYVAAGNALKPSVAGDTSKMKGMRAYFHILNQATAVAMRRGVISVGPRHTPTMLIDILDGTATQLPERFCIDGQVYIRHNGTIYNMTGARVNKLSK